MGEVNPDPPDRCDLCDWVTDDLTRERSRHYGDSEYGGGDHHSGHRGWFHWFCSVCRANGAADSHRHRKDYEPIARIISRSVHLLMADRRALESDHGEQSDGE